MKQRQQARKQSPATKPGANSQTPEELTRRFEIEKEFLEVQLQRERRAFNDIQSESGPGGAAEALRYLAKEATEKEIKRSGGVEAVTRALKAVGISFDDWRARWISSFEEQIVRIVLQAAGAPRSISEIKQWGLASSGKTEAKRVMRMAGDIDKAIVAIQELNSDGYWSRVALPGLLECLKSYRDRLTLVAQRLLRLDRSRTFKNLGHETDEWVLENIRQLTGQPFRQKTTAIMRVVYRLDAHWPVDVGTLERWQTRKHAR